MYARGILFGKMKYELGDHSFVRCPSNGLVADIDFKTKGYFSGTYNAIGGTIRDENSNTTLYELSGSWTGEMYIKDIQVSMLRVYEEQSATECTCRQTIENFCSMLVMKNRPTLLCGLWKNKMKESRKSYGIRSYRL